MRISTMEKHEAENTNVITAEDFSPAINGCFEKLSEVQWDMIKNGAWDSDVQALMADLISELIQISDKILRLVQSQTVRGESPATSSHAVPTSQPRIGLSSLKALMRSAIL